MGTVGGDFGRRKDASASCSPLFLRRTNGYRAQKATPGGYLLGLRRAQAQARRELEDIAERFEEISEATRAELHGLRNEIARAHSIGDAIDAEREDGAWPATGGCP